MIKQKISAKEYRHYRHPYNNSHMHNIKFIFFGSNQFSVLVLKRLIQNGFVPALTITVPDAPVGKKQIITPPLIKSMAQELRIAIAQPTSLKKDLSAAQTIALRHPDIGIVAEYGRFFNKTIIDLFPLGVLVAHPSLLPKWRGVTPIQSALLNGDTETGITIIQLDEHMDHGPILAQEKTPIVPDEYFYELYERLANMGGDLLSCVIPQWLNKKIIPKPQDETKTTFCKKISDMSREDGRVNTSQPIEQTYNQIRAFSTEPGCWLELSMKNEQTITIKILTAHIEHTDIQPEGLIAQKDKFGIVQKNRMLVFDQIQPQGKNKMKTQDFLRGNKDKLDIPVI